MGIFRSQHRNLSVILPLLSGTVLFLGVLIAVYITAWQAPPLNTTQYGAQIYMRASPPVIWWRGGCTTVNWRVEGVSSVYLNGQGVIGEGEQANVCVRPRFMPRLIFTVPDSQKRHLIDLPVTIMSEHQWVQASFWLWVFAVLYSLTQTLPVQRWWSTQTPHMRWHWSLLLVVMLFGVGVRLIYLERPVMLDEANTLYSYVRQPTWYDVISNYREPNNHILHSILVRLFDSTLGHSPWIFRMPAFLAGVAILPLTYIMARRFYNPPIAFMTVAFCAASYRLVDYSSDARGYTLVVVFTLGVLILGHVLKSQPHARWGWLWLAIFSALGFYSIPVMYYGLGGIALWIGASIVVENQGRLRWQLLAAWGLAFALGAILTLLLYSPVLLRNADWLLNNFMDVPLEVGVLNLLWQSAEIAYLFIFDKLPLPLVLFFGAGILISQWTTQNTSYRVPFLPPLIIWMLLVILYQYIPPLQRTWLWSLPLLLMLAAAGILRALNSLVPNEQIRFWTAHVLGIGCMLWMWGAVISVNGMDVRTGGRAIVGAEDVVLYMLEQDLIEDTLPPNNGIITQEPADYPLRFYIDYYRFDETLYLTHYLYDNELDAMRNGERRTFAYAPTWQWSSVEEIVQQRGVNVQSNDVEAVLILERTPWRLYELLPASP